MPWVMRVRASECCNERPDPRAPTDSRREALNRGGRGSFARAAMLACPSMLNDLLCMRRFGRVNSGRVQPTRTSMLDRIEQAHRAVMCGGANTFCGKGAPLRALEAGAAPRVGST